MSLMMMSKAMKIIQEKEAELAPDVQEFIYRYAYQTGDMELTARLIDEFAADGADSRQIIRKYELTKTAVPSWVEKIENLIVALEMYRIEEEKAIARIVEFMNENGIEIEKDQVREADTQELSKMIENAKAADKIKAL